MKSNLAPPAPSLTFALGAAENGAVRVEWKGTTTLDAAALLSAPVDHEERSALSEAQDYLREALGEGRRPAVEVQEEAKAASISPRTLDRARRAIGVKAQREGEPGKRGGGTWFWVLPSVKVANPKGWQPKPVTDRTDEDKSAHSSHKRDAELRLPTPTADKDTTDVGNLNGEEEGHVSVSRPSQVECKHEVAGGCWLCQREIERLTREGMAPHIARAEVLGLVKEELEL